MALDLTKLQQARQTLQARMSRGSGPSMKFWRPQEGDNEIRILPPWTTEGAFAGQFYREVHQHWNVVEGGGPLLCPKKTPNAGDDNECPICDFVEELRSRKGDIEAQQLVRDLRAKVAYFMSIIDMREPVYTAKDAAEWAKDRPDTECPFEVGDPKVQCYAATSTISEQIFNIILANQMDVTDRENGNNIVVTKIGNKDRMKTRYSVQPKIKPSPAPIPEGYQAPDLSKVGQVKKYEDLVKALAEGQSAYVAALPASTHKAAPVAGADDTNAAWGLGDSADDGDDLLSDMRKSLGE